MIQPGMKIRAVWVDSLARVGDFVRQTTILSDLYS
jgi:hypothetical protein